MRKQRNMSQIKEQNKITVRGISKTKMNKMPDRKFKVMIIKILTGLEERVEDISETLKKEIKKNQSEMKNTTIEIKNIFDGIHSRPEKTEEKINNLENRNGK